MTCAFRYTDTPGSSDDQPVDTIFNGVLRSRAFVNAGTVRPVLVISLDHFLANKCVFAKGIIEFVASCFADTDYFSRILVLITHADPAKSDEQSIGSMRVFLSDLRKSVDANFPANASQLLYYLKQQVDLALDFKESKVRVVRPMDNSTRAALMEFISKSESIPEPASVFQFSLEKGADALVQSLANEEYYNVCSWVNETFEFEKVSKVLFDLEEVGRGLCLKGDLEHSKKIVLEANKNLHSEIQRVVHTILNSTPLDKIDVKSAFEPLVGRFRAMQVIHRDAAQLLPGWISSDCLERYFQRDLAKYIEIESEKKSWEALDSCAQRVRMLGSTLECTAQVEIASANILKKIELNSARVRDFSDPDMVSAALFELEFAGKSLTGAEQEIASRAFESSRNYLFEQLILLFDELEKKIGIIEKSAVLSIEDKMEFQASVTRLYKCTRPHLRLEEFLPDEAKARYSGGFFVCFCGKLRLDGVWDLKSSREELLQRFNLFSCLVRIEDDDLKSKLKLHMDGLKAQIEFFLKNDFDSLCTAFNDLLPEKIDDTEYAPYSADRVERFNIKLDTAAQLLPIDEIHGSMICTVKFDFFFDYYHKRLRHLETKVARGISSLPTLQQCKATYLYCCETSPSLVGISDRNETLKQSFVERVLTAQNQLLETIRVQAKLVLGEVKASAGKSFFGSVIGLKNADEMYLKLDALHTLLSSEDASEVHCVRKALEDQYALFKEQYLEVFRAQAQKSISDIEMDSMVQAYKYLLPSAEAKKLIYFPEDASLLQELTSGIDSKCEGLVSVASQPLVGVMKIPLLKKLEALIRLKSNADLNHARDKVLKHLDMNFNNARAALQSAKCSEVAAFLKSSTDAAKTSLLEDVRDQFLDAICTMKRLVKQISWLDKN